MQDVSDLFGAEIEVGLHFRHLKPESHVGRGFSPLLLS